MNSFRGNYSIYEVKNWHNAETTWNFSTFSTFKKKIDSTETIRGNTVNLLIDWRFIVHFNLPLLSMFTPISIHQKVHCRQHWAYLWFLIVYYFYHLQVRQSFLTEKRHENLKWASIKKELGLQKVDKWPYGPKPKKKMKKKRTLKELTSVLGQIKTGILVRCWNDIIALSAKLNLWN